MEKKTRVATVVVTYNRCAILKDCLEAIFRQSRPTDCLIVVDNHSSDNTFDYIHTSEFLREPTAVEFPGGEIYESAFSIGQERVMIHYIRLKENSGGAGGFYTGIKHAVERGYDYVWIMDDDVIPDRNALEKLVDFAVKEEELGFVCSSVFGKNGKTMNTPAINPRPDVNGYQYWNERLDEGVVGVESATFVSVFIPAVSVLETGLPIKEFFIWGDDTEYTLRLSRWYPCYLVGASRVVHLRETGTSLSFVEEKNKNRIRFSFFLFRNTLYLARKKYFAHKKLFPMMCWVLKNSLICLLMLDFYKSYIAMKALLSFAFFNPEIEYVERK